MYVDPDNEVVFGDVFDAGSLFHDAHLREDAANAGAYLLEKEFKTKFADGISRALNRPVEVPASGIPLLSPCIPLGREESTLIAHGLPTEAIILSEDCDIEDAYGRGGKPDGRLLFAAVTPRSEDEIVRVQAQEPFDRFPLPSEGSWPGGVAELHRLFMVDVRAVTKAPAARLVRLDEDMSLKLAITWSAHTSRRGPLAAANHAEKLAHLMASNPDAREREIAQAIAEAAAAGWSFEADGLAGVARAYDEGEPPAPAIKQLTRRLRELAERASAAADRLEQS